MIRINLQSAGQRKQKRKAAAVESSGGGGGGGRGRGLAWLSGAGDFVAVLMVLLPVAGALGGSFYVHQVLLGKIEETARATRAAEAELARLKPILDELERFKKDKEQLERKLAAIKALEGARHGPVQIYAELSAIMPAQVWVTGLRETGMQANLEGLGLDAQSVAVFVSAMERSPYFANVELTSVEQVVYLGLKIKKFTLTCRFQLPPSPPPGTRTATVLAPDAAAAR